MDRKEHPAAKTVHQRLIVFTSGGQTCFKQEITLEACFLCFRREGIALLEAIAQLEFLDNIIAEASFTEVAQADSLPFGMGMEHLHKIITCILIEDEHALTVALCLLLLIGVLFFNNLNIVFAGKVLQRFIVVELLMLHHEMDGRSAFTTGKAFTDVFRGRDIK